MAFKKVSFQLNENNLSKFRKSNLPYKLPSLNGDNACNSIKSSIRSSNFQLSKSVWSRINKLKIKCETPGNLSTWEISKFRLSNFQMVLNEMLVRGYHRSFSTLFNINEERERKRLEEGPDSTRWKLPSLAVHPKLDEIMNYLIMIEDAQRSNDYSNLMKATNLLTNIFGQCQEDSWIIQMFVALELDSSTDVTYDAGYMKAIANLNAGINAAKSNDLLLAAEHLARVFSMAYSHNWKDPNGNCLSKVCSEHLCQVYLQLAYLNETNKPSQMLSYLKQAHEISKESGIKSIEATCCLELGKVFEKLNNIDMAIAYFRGLFEVARNINDQNKLGFACEAIGRCYEKQHNKVEAMRYLEKFVQISEKSCDWQEYARACRILGETFNRYGEYEKSKTAFRNSYQVTFCLNSQSSFNESRILNGVAEGNDFNFKLHGHIGSESRPMIDGFLSFRSNALDIDSEVFFGGLADGEVTTFEKRAEDIKSRRDATLDVQ